MIQFYEMQKQVKHIYMSEVREWLPLGERVTGRGHKRGFCNVGNFFGGVLVTWVGSLFGNSHL